MEPEPLVTVAAILEVPPVVAAEFLLTVETGPRGRIRLLGEDPIPVGGGPRHFTVERDGHRLRVDVDPDRRTLAVQGGWWYRGEYTLDPDGPHTRLTHRVHNVAGRGSGWAVPLANRLFLGFADRTRAGFADTVAVLGARLDCPTRVLSTD